MKYLLFILLFLGSCKIAVKGDQLAFIGIDDEHTLVNMDGMYMIEPIMARQVTQI